MKKHSPVAAALLITALVAALVAISGCGEKQEVITSRPNSVDLMLDFYPNADHVGIYAALADGDFKRAGLDVHVREPDSASTPLKLLAAGKVDYAISYQPEVMLARDAGLPVVSIAAIVQRPLTSVMALNKKQLPTVKALAGKSVGTAGLPYQSAYLKTILETAGVPESKVKEVDVGFNLVPAMLSKKVDATLGAFWNYEGIELEQQGKKPRIIPVDKAGVPTYNELVLVARESTLDEDGGTTRGLLGGIKNGYEAARENPAKAVGQLVKANRDLKPKLQLASVKATMPIFFPDNSRRPYGFQNPTEWLEFGNWMYAERLLNEKPDTAKAFSNKYLPPQD